MTAVEKLESRKVGIIVVAHAPLADAMVRVVEHVAGPQDHWRSLDIDPSDNNQEQRSLLLSIVEKVDAGAGVLIFADMFGGTPTNLAFSVSVPGKIEVIAGMNLPMLIKAASDRESYSVKELVSIVCESGKKYIRSGTEILD